MANTYLDPFQYQLQPTGLVLSSYIGNLFRFAGTQSAASTTLSIPASAILVTLQAYDYLYIFDNGSSEIVQVASEVTIGATSIPLVAATQYAHNAGVVVCSDGTSGVVGSLGQQLFTASRWVEDICHQALWSTAYTNEILTMPTMRAAIDNRWNLHFRPRHFPITALTSVSMQINQQYTIPIDPTQAIIDSDQQTVDVPNINYLASNLPPTQASPFIWLPIDRQMNAWITLAYTAGYAVGQLPWPVVRACSLLVNECYKTLENPIGADSIAQKGRNVTFTLRGDQSGESLLVKQAMKLLDPYIAQSF